MKLIITSIILLMFEPHMIAQKAFVSIGNGISGMSSNFENRYTSNYNVNLKTGLDLKLSKFKIRTSIGYFSLRAKIIDNKRALNYSSIKISTGVGYNIFSNWALIGQIYIGMPTKKSIRISSPGYNYDFDPIDISYSIEAVKNINISNCNCISLGLEYSKSIDGIIDNNFWQKDNLIPYFLNANIYYIFQKS
ncbi:MAG: hypothetical protein IPN29_17555 [Saprospiraceae bacterium]|nr:hypothetical protein [Saprospiraceae bacterium]